MPWPMRRSKMRSLDSQGMRNFAGIDLSMEAVPDATTLLKFRHLLEAHNLTRRIFAEVNALLNERKLLIERRHHSWMPRSSRRLPRPRTRARNAILRCTRPRKATNGISG